MPSFGITYLDHTIDYICPTASTVDDTAITLEVIAGEDEKDPQWVRGQVNKVVYSKAKEDNVKGLGSISFLDQTDGIIRSLPLLVRFNEKLYPTLGLEMVRVGSKQKNIYVELNEVGITSISARPHNI